MTPRTVVVGGGLAGLAAALAAADAGQDVTLLEAGARPGGSVQTRRQDGFLLELGPNTVRPTPTLWSLLGRLGLDKEALFADARAPRYVDYRGRLHPVPMSPLSLACSRLLTARGRLRIFSEPLQRRGTEPDETLRDFVTRRLGPEAAERLVEPFVSGVFAGDAARLEASAAFPLLTQWEREHGSLLAGAIASRRNRPAGPRPPRGLVSFRDGLETLPRAMAAGLGAGLRTACGARAVEPAGDGWRVLTDGGRFEADRVLIATPAPAAADIVSGFAADAAGALAAIPHAPVAVLHLGWPESALVRPLAGFGHLVCPDPSRRILGGVWSSSLFPERAPEGQVLLTVFMGGARDRDALALADADLVERAAADLRDEGLVRGDPVPLLVTRWPRAIPQYERGHAARIAALAETEARYEGLRFLGSYRGGVSVGDVVRTGLEAGSVLV
jgi:protoporphyrinogen/coproporphyrinogen III oxidase